MTYQTPVQYQLKRSSIGLWVCSVCFQHDLDHPGEVHQDHQMICACPDCVTPIAGPDAEPNVKRRHYGELWYCERCSRPDHNHQLGYCQCPGCPTFCCLRTPAEFRLQMAPSGKWLCPRCLAFVVAHPDDPHEDHSQICVTRGCNAKPRYHTAKGMICDSCRYRQRRAAAFEAQAQTTGIKDFFSPTG